MTTPTEFEMKSAIIEVLNLEDITPDDIGADEDLFGNTGLPVPDVWPLQHPVVYTFIWIVVLLVVFVPIAVRTYLRAAVR